MLLLLDNLLTDIGVVDILDAANGIEVIDIYRRTRPDIVFLDIQMPDRDGLAALREIKALNAEAYVVMVSGYGSADNVKTAIAAGANGFIVKPYRKHRICGVMDRYAARRRTSRSPIAAIADPQ